MNASVTFSVSPWLLFLIVPVFAAIIALFFIGKKKGSRVTVNRVLSAILQCAAATCCIFALAGIRVEYDEPNDPAELVILVDRSDTAKGQREAMDGFVRDVLEANGGRCRVAVVLFGYGQKIALEMGEHDAESAYAQYLAAVSESPSDRATDIASALRLAWDPTPGAVSLISDPSHAKVLILSDGLETDGDAVGAAKALTRDGVQIETSFFADGYLADTSILGVNSPAQSLFANREFEFSVTVKSSFSAETVLSYTDTDEQGNEKEGSIRADLKAGTQELVLKHSFESTGFHEIALRLEVAGDETEENNVFCSYFEVAESNRLLILETYEGESALLRSSLEQTAEEGLVIETETLQNAGDMTAEELSLYSEVILYNSAQKDMTANFQNALYQYVNDLGGGLFTVGGFQKDGNGDIMMEPKFRESDVEVPVRHSYLEEDLKGSVFASMLPVTVEEYKPAVAVVFVLDVSSSMATPSGPLRTAIREAQDVLEYDLEPRDYAGIITLQDTYSEVDPLRPLTQKDELKASLEEWKDFYDFNACTKYAPALQQAVSMLTLAPSNVARKHIVLLSDGGPGDNFATYGKAMENAEKLGISLTVVTYYRRTRVIDGELYYFNHDYDVKGYEINVGNMQKLAGYGNGSHVLIPRDTYPGWRGTVRKDMRLDELGFIGYDSYNPRMGERSSEVLGDLTNLDLKALTLGGYFPSRPKVDETVTVPLLAEGSPLYAQWTLGAGKVGSILIDLEGVWSKELFEKETGKVLLNNIAASLLRQVKPAAAPDIEATLSDNNFSTQVNVYGFDAKEEDAKLVAFVLSPDAAEEPQKFDLSALSLGGNRFVFENPKVGVYTVQLLKVKKEFDFMDGAVRSLADIPADALLETVELYRPFSYSKEYDGRADPYATGQELLAALSTRQAADGLSYSKFVYDAEAVFAENGLAHRVDDPRQGLLIAALVLYFAGIVLRRYKLPSGRSGGRTA